MSDQNLPLMLGTGLNGLVGSKIVDLLKTSYEFENLDINHPTQPVDITDEIQLQNVIGHSPAKFLVHCAAFTDVTAAWLQTGDKSGLAYRVNVLGTENIAKVCRQNHIHLIHISTAYVFDGQKTEPYVESDQPNPIEWYGQTKLWAEEAVNQYADDFTILRIDQPFRSDSFVKADIVRRIAKGLTADTLPPQFNNHTFGPTFIDDFAQVINIVIENKLTGLYHATSNESWTDFEFARLVAQKLDMVNKIRPGDLESYIKTSQRPYQKNTALNCEKLYNLIKFAPRSIAQAVESCQL